MSACDGWVALDPDRPDQRRPLTRDEWAEHQAACEKCRDPWFANPLPAEWVRLHPKEEA